MRIEEILRGSRGWDFVAVVEPLLGHWQAHFFEEEFIAFGDLAVFFGAVEFDF